MLPVKRTTAGTELRFADSDYAKKQCTDFSSAAGSGAGTSAAASSPVDMAGGRSLNGTNVKNLVLAGVKSVTPHDVGTVELWDLSSSFVFSEEDLGKNRALASVQKLQEVNNAEIIGTLTSELTKEHLSNFQAVVFTDVSLEKPPEGGKMGETPRKIDMEELMSYSDNLTEVLREEKDVVGLKQFLRQSESLQSQCEKDLNEVQKSIKDYEQKIHECKQKAAAAISQSASDAELDSLQKELDDEQKLENTLREDLRVIITEIDDLEQQRVSGEKEMQTIKKNEQDELRTQMKLSMYASVTNIIPYLEDMSKVSGHIVARDKKVVDKFEFDPSEDTAFDTCNNLWKMINL